MIGRVEIEQSKYQIGKAEARLAHQRVVVNRLGFDAEPRYADLANEVSMLMEAKLAILRAKHKQLADAAGRRPPSRVVDNE